MKKRFSLAVISLVLLGLTSTAQIPRTLQIGITNGVVTLSSQFSPGYFVGYLETITNLSSPIVWNPTEPTNFESGETDSFYATNSQSFFRLRQGWPIFQFAIFYNLNMEIAPASAMTVSGPVFCNAGIWAGSSTLTFNSSVDGVGQIVTNTIDPFAAGWIGSGSPTFTLSGQPVSAGGPLNLGNGIYNAPTNSKAILNLPPNGLGSPNPAAFAPSNQIYFFNECDLIISNSANGLPGANGTNDFIWFQDEFQGIILRHLTNDVLKQKLSGSNFQPSNILYAGFSFVTNVTFYDYREAKNVQAVQIDIAKFNKWLTNSADEGPRWNNDNIGDKGYGIGSIYIYNNVPWSSTNLPAVRLVNGQQLPSTSQFGLTTSGLTIATPQPLYVLGNYNVQTNSGGGSSAGTTNTAYTYPAALMADAVTILSANWNDSLNSGSSRSSVPAAANATVNAAVLEGIVQSTGSHYSGGVENSLRLLEDWSANALTYNGSTVVMFPSQYATNFWGSTNYITGVPVYSPPTLNWNFDSNFTNIAKLPPLTPLVLNFISP